MAAMVLMLYTMALILALTPLSAIVSCLKVASKLKEKMYVLYLNPG